jgi:hypothetical protein
MLDVEHHQPAFAAQLGDSFAHFRGRNPVLGGFIDVDVAIDDMRRCEPQLCKVRPVRIHQRVIEAQ